MWAPAHTRSGDPGHWGPGQLPPALVENQSKAAVVQDGTGLGYTAVGAGLRSPGHAGGMGACGRVIPLGIMRLQDHGWDLSTFGLERSQDNIKTR